MTDFLVQYSRFCNLLESLHSLNHKLTTLLPRLVGLDVIYDITTAKRLAYEIVMESMDGNQPVHAVLRMVAWFIRFRLNDSAEPALLNFFEQMELSVFCSLGRYTSVSPSRWRRAWAGVQIGEDTLTFASDDLDSTVKSYVQSSLGGLSVDLTPPLGYRIRVLHTAIVQAEPSVLDLVSTKVNYFHRADRDCPAQSIVYMCCHPSMLKRLRQCAEDASQSNTSLVTDPFFSCSYVVADDNIRAGDQLSCQNLKVEKSGKFTDFLCQMILGVAHGRDLDRFQKPLLDSTIFDTNISPLQLGLLLTLFGMLNLRLDGDHRERRLHHLEKIRQCYALFNDFGSNFKI